MKLLVPPDYLSVAEWLLPQCKSLVAFCTVLTFPTTSCAATITLIVEMHATSWVSLKSLVWIHVCGAVQA